MAVERRKDKKNRVLKEGEYQRSCGTYEFKWRDKAAADILSVQLLLKS